MNNHIQQSQLRTILINYIVDVMQQNNISAIEMENALIYVLNSLKDQVKEELIASFLQEKQELQNQINELLSSNEKDEEE